MKIDKIKEWERKIENHKKKREKHREKAKQESLVITRLSRHIVTYIKRESQDNN